ncbi:MAG TPA: small multi-drug export protein [Rectinemataceae bacterium]
MDPSTLLFTAILAFLPISELRGAIPYATARGVDLLTAALVGTALNALVPLIAYAFLSTVHKLLYRLVVYRGFFDRFVEKARRKVHEKVEKYGYWGLLVFVAIPLPVTGAWTGTLGAWILGMDRKKSILAIAGGVIVAGIIVSFLVALLGSGARSIFLKYI